ncbi:MAG: tRNA lysidine(34) synthetase TilS [Actinobacteria bacterium]|nr:tRNA lysidine(34) synthetase TilS [Actinomycetota bacterium]
MTAPDATDRVLSAARRSGLIARGDRLLVLLSGGADSACLLDVAVRLGARVSALHVDHGLRAGSADDADVCRALCEARGVPLAVQRIELRSVAGTGNLQAEARERRYELAERHAEGDYATAHTATDQAETVLYRLAVSPGRRALLGMPARRGRLVRPLLAVSRDETRAYCRAQGIRWTDDPTNDDVRFARARVRHRVLPELRELNPAVDRTIAETAAQLRDEAEVLDRAASEALERLGGPTVAVAALAELPPALARVVLRRAAEDAAGERSVPLPRRDVERILGVDGDGTSTIELGGGVRALVEYGWVRFEAGRQPGPPASVPLTIPGSATFGPWRLDARAGTDGDEVLDAAALGAEVAVRAWRAGDRMRPLGLGGSKSLQDLFTDRKVPRVERASWPVIEAEGEIACVPAVAVGERFRPGDGPRVALSVTRAPG